MADYNNLIDEHIHYSQSLAAVSQIEKLSQKRGKNSNNERFKVTPDTYYPNTYMNRNELRQEMNRKSVTYQDLRKEIGGSIRNYDDPEDEDNLIIGQLHVEFLQCFGLPTTSAFREVSAFGIAVCGSHAFSTDVMPPVGNPMWLCKMQRAGIFPLRSAYQRLYAGIFDHGSALDKSSPTVKKRDEFIGRVVIDIARLRPGCVYDITLPLRLSAHTFSREPRGAIRVRIHLQYDSERAAVASYLPSLDDPQPIKTRLNPNEQHKIHCLDEKAFRNIAQVVHGKDMQGKFSMSIMKATIREFNFLRIHYFRYLRKRELYNLRWWIHPFISGFVFVAWMHAVYANTVRYVPAHIVTFLLLHLYRNYVHYAANCGHGFLGPSIEELFLALLYGTSDSPKKYIVPLNMEREEQPHDTVHLESRSSSRSSVDFENGDNKDDGGKEEVKSSRGEFTRTSSVKGTFQSESDRATVIPIRQIAEHMRQALPVRDYKSRMKTYKDCFTGTEAVDFLLTHGYANSRSQAVVLGNRLANETKLFEHITRKYRFEDMTHRYQFLEYDSQTYVITGRKPKGERLFRLIGFLNDGDVGRYKHLEFPFASQKDDPRFTVEESIVIRSLESKKEQEQRRQEMQEIRPSDSFDDFDLQSDGDEEKMFLGKEANSENLFALVASPKSPPQRGFARAAASFRRLTTSSTLKTPSKDLLHIPSLKSPSKDLLHMQIPPLPLASIEMSPRIKQVSTEAAAVMKSGLNRLPMGPEAATAVTSGLRKAQELQEMAVTSGLRKAQESATAVTSGLRKAQELQEMAVTSGLRKAQESATAVTSGLRKAQELQEMAVTSGLRKAQELQEIARLKGLRNAQELEEIMGSHKESSASFRMSGIIDRNAIYESYGDVVEVSERRFVPDDSVVIEEKILVKPPPQNVNEKVAEKKGNSFAKTVADARHSVHGVFGHIFNDRVFKVDHTVHPKEDDPDDESVIFLKKDRSKSRKESSEKKTPYQSVTEENRKILQIKRYSHSNQMINRIGGVVQPVVEILQIGVFLGRVGFNIYTWQDPIFSFWFAILGPVLVVILYIAPYRIIFGVIGAVFLGPHNWALRLYREQLPDYQPPDFDRVVRKKRRANSLDHKEKEFSDCTIFSSTTPGGNYHGHIEPKKLRTVVVPTSVLKYNHRFYEWPPEAKYARVYQSSAEDLFRPSRQQRGGSNMRTIDESDHENYEHESDDSSDEDCSSDSSSGLLNAETQRFSAGRVARRQPRRGSLINPGEFKQRVAGGLTDLKYKRKSKIKIHGAPVPSTVNVQKRNGKARVKHSIWSLKMKKG